MTIISPFLSAMDAQQATMGAAPPDKRLGENGSAEFSAAGVGDALVSLFFKLVRGCPDVKELYEAAAKEASTPTAMADLVVLAFQTRATRGMGKGEKDLFYQLMALLPADAAKATLSLVPHYGYYKDLLALAAQPALADRCIALFAEALRTDEAELATATAEGRTPKLSLAAKYAPREGGHYDRPPLRLGRTLAMAMFGEANTTAAQRKYRQLVANLNRALGTTEVLMAANRYDEIQFSRVASLCLNRQRKAFLNEALKQLPTPEEDETGNRHPEDESRVAARKALRAAMLSRKGVNGKALQPHEVAAKCMRGRLSTVEIDLMDAQWESLRAGVQEALDAAAKARAEGVAEAAAASAGLESTVAALRAALPSHVDLSKLVALVDVSGSMTGTPMEAAIGLGILVSELSAPAFRDRVITFESQPRWVSLAGHRGVAAKVDELKRAPWGGSTNFAAACEMILRGAEEAKLKPDEVPDLIVFSDMQFDCAGGSSWETHLERLTRRFAEVGTRVCGEPYAPPRIVFWNLRGDTCGYPAQANTPNVQMLSGYSPALLKLVLTGADLVADEVEVVGPDGKVRVVRVGPTPSETLRQALDDAAFDPVRLALAGVEAGPLTGYSFDR